MDNFPHNVLFPESELVTSGNDLPSFPGNVFLLSISPRWTKLASGCVACTWSGGGGLL